MSRSSALTVMLCALAALLPPSAHAVPIVSAGYEVDAFATGIGASTGMTFGADGNLYVTDYLGRVLRVDSAGNVTTLASGVDFLTDVARTAEGRIFVTSGGGGSVYEVIGDQLQLFRGGFSFPTSVEAWGNDLYVANSGIGLISRIAADGSVTVLPLSLSAPNGPYGLSFDSHGNLFFIDHATGNVYRYGSDGVLTTISTASAFGGTFSGIGFDGDLFFTDVNAGQLLRTDRTGTTTVVASGFAGKTAPPAIGPQGIAYDGANSLYVADGGSIWRIREPVAVPEPGSAGLILLGLLLLMVRSLSHRSPAAAIPWQQAARRTKRRAT